MFKINSKMFVPRARSYLCRNVNVSSHTVIQEASSKLRADTTGSCSFSGCLLFPTLGWKIQNQIPPWPSFALQTRTLTTNSTARRRSHTGLCKALLETLRPGHDSGAEGGGASLRSGVTTETPASTVCVCVCVKLPAGA